MRKLTIIFIFCSGLIFGQLPQANQKVLDYAIAHQGVKVGDGICGTFVKAALSENDKYWKSHYPSKRGIVDLGRKLKKNELVLPGDIVEFIEVVGDDYVAPSHAGIVKEVISEDKIVVLDQNSGNRQGKKNKVDSWVVDKNKIIKGRLIFYRPI